MKNLNLSFFALALGALAFFSSCSAAKQVKALESEKMNMERSISELNKEKIKLTSDLDKTNNALTLANDKLAKDVAEMSALKKLLRVEDMKIQKMKKELTSAFSGYDKNAISIDERDGRLIVVMQNKILYRPGKVDLDDKGIEAIQTISQVFKANKGLNILVESHTDDTPINNPKFKDNWDLSVARSVTVVRMLEKYGINPTRMTAAGRGEFVPVSKVMAINSEAKATNRRTEFVISPNMRGLYKLLAESDATFSMK